MNEINIISVYAKCNDLFGMTLLKDDKIIRDYNGYIPFEFLQNNTDGLSFDIDIETGKILNWDSNLVKKTLELFLEKTKRQKDKMITSYDEFDEDDEDDEFDEDDEDEQFEQFIKERNNVTDTIPEDVLISKFNKLNLEIKKFKDIYPINNFDSNDSELLIRLTSKRYPLDAPIQMMYICLLLFNNQISCNIKKLNCIDIYVNKKDIDKSKNILNINNFFNLNIDNINDFINKI
jgi:hypothetical protein